MAMKDLNINFDELKTLATTVGKRADSFSTTLDNINTANDNLSKYWTGDDAKNYLSKMKEQAKTMKDLKDAIYEMSKFLKNVSDSYKKAMEANRDAIKMD